MLSVIKRLWDDAREATTVDMLFIGGPLNGEREKCPVTQRQFHVEGQGSYEVAYFGFEAFVSQRVFVWEGCHFTEALEMVLDCYHEHGDRPF